MQTYSKCRVIVILIKGKNITKYLFNNSGRTPQYDAFIQSTEPTCFDWIIFNIILYIWPNFMVIR